MSRCGRARSSRRLRRDRSIRRWTGNAATSTGRPHLLLWLLPNRMLWTHSARIGMSHLRLLLHSVLGTHTSVLWLMRWTSHGSRIVRLSGIALPNEHLSRTEIGLALALHGHTRPHFFSGYHIGSDKATSHLITGGHGRAHSLHHTWLG